MSRSKRTPLFCPVSTCRPRLSYRLQAARILGSTWFPLRADFPLVRVSRSAPGACPCFLLLAIWAGRTPHPGHLAILALWIRGLRVWSSHAVCGFGGG